MAHGDTHGNLCLATVTSAEFMPGTMVMLASFLETNPWFDGDIVIFQRGLAEKHRRLLSCFQRVKFIEVSDELEDKLRELAQALPGLGLERKIARFYSLETFRLSGYGRVLFCDGDILFTGDISSVLGARERGLRCCGDYYHYKGMSRDAETFLPIEAAGAGKPLARTFNSGFMVVDEEFLAPVHYRGLLALLEPGVWQKVKAPHTDQVVLNFYFQKRCVLLSGRYNLLVPAAADIFAKEGLNHRDIKVLHFLGPVKPWNCLDTIETVAADGAVIRYFRDWHRYYLDWLPRLHLRSRWVKGGGPG
jgi:lipopolysaccharide biosynthesis glycosyltransferase